MEPFPQYTTILTMVRSENTSARALGLKQIWRYSCDKVEWAVKIGETEVLKEIISNCSHEDSNVRITALHCLWNLSAYEANKGKIVVEGAVTPLLNLLATKNKPIMDCVSAIIQNVSESKFSSGAKNQYQYRIAQEGVIQEFARLLSQYSDIIELRFKVCLTIANLSMHPQNRQEIEATQALKEILKLVLDASVDLCNQDKLFANWLGLQPFVALLRSQYTEVQLLALFCLAKFTSFKAESAYHKYFWRDLSLNEGLNPIIELARSPYDYLRKYAIRILSNVNIQYEEDPIIIPESTLCKDLKKLYLSTQSEMSHSSATPTDVTLVIDGKPLRCHKIILSTRCSYFDALFKHWQSGESDSANTKKSELIIQGFDYDVVNLVVEYLYTDTVQLNWNNAIDVLGFRQVWIRKTESYV
eukprot:TRINITY_DN4482_c0_g1_i5.p1 TRINITY_DN4482_c0_g1~~TRINITY_DN4482_c0_g1_i5.p1  ORF type:complete len:415 (-),score=60.16 TRINITY_DN4482_c0_g1_i5:105-1349(-)